MTPGLVGKALLTWTCILFLAVINGALRETVIVPVLGPALGLTLSGFLLILFIAGVTHLALPWLGARRTIQFIAIGLGWFFLTLLFEFSFGLLQGKPLSELLSAYTFRGGNIWPLVLLVTTTAPYLAARFRGWVE